MTIPDRDECMKILIEHKVPDNIIKHSLKVTEIAMDISKKLSSVGIPVNNELMEAAGLLHDIAKAEPGDHASKAKALLEEMGYDKVAEVISTHGLYHLVDLKPRTIEQKILFYADKRVIDDRITSVEERFEYLKKRYPDMDKKKIRMQYNFTKKIEKELEI